MPPVTGLAAVAVRAHVRSVELLVDEVRTLASAAVAATQVGTTEAAIEALATVDAAADGEALANADGLGDAGALAVAVGSD